MKVYHGSDTRVEKKSKQWQEIYEMLKTELKLTTNH